VDENGSCWNRLEEIYFYKIDEPQHGWAIQRVYNDDSSLDELMLVRDSHLVLVPEGYHPVVAPPGYNVYYLNFLAGSAQSLMSKDDERFAWVKEAWRAKDPRCHWLSRKWRKTETMKTYDLITLGRSSIDLYANEVGEPFINIKSFAAYVGGSPTNIAVGTRRLGLKVALLTAVGPDPVGDFLLNFLEQEGIDTRFIPRKPGRRTSAVILGIEPPDKFPLVYYRDNCADIELTIDDILAAPVADSRVLEISGTALSKEPSRSAAFFAAELARAAGTKIVLDIDFRADQWHDAPSA
jgi:hypothetical protein